MDCSMPGFPVCHNVPEFAQIHFHWVNDTIQHFHPLSSLQSCPASESLPVSPLFSSSGQSVGPSASISVLPMNRLVIFRADWFDLHAIQGTLQSFPKPQNESINSFALSLPYGPTLTSIHDCYRVKACSAHHTKGQCIRETRCWGKEETLTGESADQEDGRLTPQNNHLIGVWMPNSSLDQRERSNE